ncbi:AMP-dependent synthetase and ligase [Xylanimonas cellulosilytica DSM 15894]|uniref:Acyl-CoA synthetase n=1 Tax=Xylanimonas cellulosilytica (strain DSM 15894 / JCM 12276 / CECT 5975 / KCTC 9989 / LMG 20990 / NBRC 107835 / XIL07) TaxID=446471 RepID=D1BTP3_XYLCX|nr:AMP-dependent synthetase/ligase [Xylanimonas cellulosilytica]ACZ31022.1 AMP-dependent synthetase and ligase [Xylanimonas cellulosilytica DSM 15894]
MDESTIPLRVELPLATNLNTVIADRLRSGPDDVFAEVPRDGAWLPVTVREFDAAVVAAAKGLVALGVGPGDSVGIMSRTRYEWTLLDFAAWAAGAVPVPIYETSSAEQVQWILSDAAVTVLVVESAENAATVAEVRDQVPACREVLVIDDDAVGRLTAAGADVPDAEIERRRSLATLDDIATIIYTSGTTGRPKGAELTHRNFVSLTTNTVPEVPEVFAAPGGRTLLFLPLAHVFARFVEVLAIRSGTVLAHSPDIRTLVDDLGAFRPTYILAVPRVFEKVYNSAEQTAAAGGKLKIFRWAAATAIRWSRALDTAKGPSAWLSVQHKVADALVYGKLRAKLGGQTRYAVSGGGPLGERLGHFYRGIGLTVLEGYGLTETTAPTCVNRPAALRIGTVGLQLPGCGVRIAPDGEILLKGHHVFRGYHNNPQATAEAFDGEWFRTGDLGSLDDEGFLRITGRKKEIIVTAAGKNVAPAVLEDRLRAHALVSQCVVVGDNRPFIGALVTLDPEGLPGWLSMHGKEPMSIDEARTDPDVLAALDEAVTRANKAVSRAESIRKFTVLDKDFTVENGYLTPSLKFKRAQVLRDFAPQIETLYAPSQDRESLHV